MTDARLNAGEMPYAWYWADYERYCAMSGDSELVKPVRIMDERSETTPLDPWYFYQDTWAAKRILETRPEWLLDVGSTSLLLGILSLVVPVVSVDVRPLPIELPNLTCHNGNITDLPYEDATVPMASSLSVVEHIGLGRYGDPIDPAGSEKACRELQRVVRPGGRILVSVPITETPVTLFNMHRLLTKTQIREWFAGADLVGGIEIVGDGMTVWCAEFLKR